MKLPKLLGIVAVMGGLGLVGLGLGRDASGMDGAAGQQVQRVQPGVLLPGGGSAIGVSVRDVDAADQKRANLPRLDGVAIEEVRSDSPAARAGLRVGDVIVEFDGERVRSARQLARLVRETPAGRTVKAVLFRDGRRTEVDIIPEAGAAGGLVDDLARGTFEELRRSLRNIPDALPRFEVPDFDISVRMWSGRLGVRVQDLNPELATYFGVKTGVLVSSVSQGSAAAKAGMKAGDVITSIDGARIEDTADLSRQLRQLDSGEAFTVGIVRDRKEMKLDAQLEPFDRRPRQVPRQPV